MSKSGSNKVIRKANWYTHKTLPKVWESNPVGIITSDWHLSDTPPLCRSVGQDWRWVQEGFIQQIKDLQSVLGKYGELPIIIAGDIFDRWNNSIEFTNWVIERMPSNVFTVPGQHDLAYHSDAYVDYKRTSYYNLVLAKVINDVDCEYPIPTNTGLYLHGYGWGKEIEPCTKKLKGDIKVAVIHKYMWRGGESYNGHFSHTPPEAKLTQFNKILSTYDVAVIGDNHMAWIGLAGKCSVFNCGTFIRRKKHEIPMKPRVGIICADKSVHIYELDIKKDKITDEGPLESPVILTDYAIERLKENMHVEGFRDRLIQKMANLNPMVRRILQTVIDQI